MSGIKLWGFAVDYENTLHQVSPVLHGNNSLLKFALSIRCMHILFFFLHLNGATDGTIRNHRNHRYKVLFPCNTFDAHVNISPSIKCGLHFCLKHISCS